MTGVEEAWRTLDRLFPYLLIKLRKKKMGSCETESQGANGSQTYQVSDGGVMTLMTSDHLLCQ